LTVLELELTAPLSLSWVPPQLLIRGEYLKTLLHNALESLPSCYWCQGDKSTGKTLTARFLLSELHAIGYQNSLLIPCQTSVPQTLKTLTSTYSRFRDTLTTTVTRLLPNHRNPILVFDDYCNDLSQRLFWDREIKGLFDHYTSRQLNPCFLFLTQRNFKDIDRDKVFAPDTLDRLQLKPLVFGDYNADEIYDILTQRLQYCLKPDQWKTGAVHLIAARTTRIGNNIRYALTFLHRSIQLAKGCLDDEAVEHAWSDLKSEFWKTQLLSLSPHSGLIVYLLAQHSEIPNTRFTIHEIGDFYYNACRAIGANALAQRMLYYLLEGLAQKGYVTNTRERLGKHRVIRYALTERPENILLGGQAISWKEHLT